jgi:hypothetical protein
MSEAVEDCQDPHNYPACLDALLTVGLAANIARLNNHVSAVGQTKHTVLAR